MRLLLTFAFAIGLLAAKASYACSPIFPGRGEEMLHSFLRNKPVQQDAACAFQHGGIYDYIKAGPAQDLGKGRVYQIYGFDTALIVDCNNRGLLHILGKENIEMSTTCGPYNELSIYFPPNGTFDLAHGETLEELASYAKAEGMDLSRPTTEQLYQSPRRRDRFDIFCGCKVFYPNSAGAVQ